MYAIVAYVVTYFEQAKTYAGQLKIMNYLPGMVL